MYLIADMAGEHVMTPEGKWRQRNQIGDMTGRKIACLTFRTFQQAQAFCDEQRLQDIHCQPATIWGYPCSVPTLGDN